MWRSRLLRSICFPLVCFAAGCGGSTKPAESSAPAAGTHTSTRPSDEDASGSDDTSSAAVARRATCDDGTCSPCGDALCPNGWYCDETAPGGPACGWLPECAQKPGCGCVKKALSGCGCEEKAGAAHLSCH